MIHKIHALMSSREATSNLSFLASLPPHGEICSKHPAGASDGKSTSSRVRVYRLTYFFCASFFCLFFCVLYLTISSSTPSQVSTRSCISLVASPNMSSAQAPNDAEKNIEIWKVKKLIKRLEAARGNGTSMISLIIRMLSITLESDMSRC